MLYFHSEIGNNVIVVSRLLCYVKIQTSYLLCNAQSMLCSVQPMLCSVQSMLCSVQPILCIYSAAHLHIQSVCLFSRLMIQNDVEMLSFSLCVCVCAAISSRWFQD